MDTGVLGGNIHHRLLRALRGLESLAAARVLGLNKLLLSHDLAKLGRFNRRRRLAVEVMREQSVWRSTDLAMQLMRLVTVTAGVNASGAVSAY